VLAKLLDFGLAASVDDSFLERITRSQQVLGSLPYMAPEQFAGARPTFSIDLYALGVVLYEASAGRLPFLAPSAAALIHHILASPPQHIGAVRPETPPELDRLIARLLAKDPNERFPSAGALLDAFSELRRGSARPTHPSKHPSSRPPAASPSSLPPTRYVAQTPIPMGADIPALAVPPLPSMVADYPSGIPPHASGPIGVPFDSSIPPPVHPIPPTTAMPSPEARLPREADWSSGQVVPPTSYPSGPQQRSRTSPLFFLLVAAIGIAAFAVVALVTVVVLTASSPKTSAVQPVAVEPVTVSVVERDAGPGAIVEVEIPDAGPGAVVEERPRDAGRRALGVRAMTPDPPDPPPPTMRGMWTGEIIEAPF
jgi:serine/threonine-protein kinase